MSTSGTGRRHQVAAPQRVALIHVPKLLERHHALGWCSRIHFIAQGMWSLAEALQRAGHHVEIVHLGIEKLLDHGFSLADHLAEGDFDLAAFSLHWHAQTFDALDAAQQVAAALPRLRILFGGLTASWFAEEILRSEPWATAVVVGEGEKPLLDYLRARGEEELAEVPNLCWRRNNGELVRNPLRWWADDDELSGWDFASWELLRHAELYPALNWRMAWSPRLALSSFRPDATLFGLPLARGCTGTCSWCSGSHGSLRQALGRRALAVRNPEAVLRTARAAAAFGFDRLYACHDPDPGPQHRLLASVEALGTLCPRVRLDMELFGLPHRELMSAMRRNLRHDSVLVLSPETACEALRKRHFSFTYSNRELEDALHAAASNEIPVRLYFGVGLPGETREMVQRTASWSRELRGRHPNLQRSYAAPVPMEPGAPWWLHPERYGVRSRWRSLEDFRRAHGQADFQLGYATAELEEEEILELHRTLFEPQHERPDRLVDPGEPPPAGVREHGPARRKAR